MATNYPTSNDVFTEPSTPATVPLGSAGDSSPPRTHTEHHRDLGDAIIALQANSPLLGHDHSGTGARATNKLLQVNTHQSADTDTSTSAIHHTLGTGANQAAPGNHTHPGPGAISTPGQATGAVTTVSAAYVFLSGGPGTTLSVTTGQKISIRWYCHAKTTNALGGAWAAVALSGSETVAATDTNACLSTDTSGVSISREWIYTALATGSLTATIHHRVGSGMTAEFWNRYILMQIVG